MMLRGFGAASILGGVLASVMPACSATANVSEVYMSLDEDGSRQRTKFFTDSASIYCIAQVGVGRRDVTLEMIIRQSAADPELKGEVQGGFNTVVAAIDVRPEVTKDQPRLVQMKLIRMKPDEAGQPKEDEETFFPAGAYRCEVKLDGQPAGNASFTVEYPDCPTKTITPGADCAGFYPLGTECPIAGATGASDPKCACAKAKGWECDP